MPPGFVQVAAGRLVAAEQAEALLLVEDARERLVEDGERDGRRRGRRRSACSRRPVRGRSRATRGVAALEPFGGRRCGCAHEQRDPTPVASAPGAAGRDRSAGSAVSVAAALRKPGLRRHLLVHAVQDRRGAVGRRVVGADERLRAPTGRAARSSGSAAARTRSATRSAATSRALGAGLERARAASSAETVRAAGASTCRARSGTSTSSPRPCRRRSRPRTASGTCSCSGWSAMSVFRFWFWPL